MDCERARAYQPKGKPAKRKMNVLRPHYPADLDHGGPSQQRPRPNIIPSPTHLGLRGFETRVLAPTWHPIIRNSVPKPGTGRDERKRMLNQNQTQMGSGGMRWYGVQRFTKPAAIPDLGAADRG